MAIIKTMAKEERRHLALHQRGMESRQFHHRFRKVVPDICPQCCYGDNFRGSLQDIHRSAGNWLELDRQSYREGCRTVGINAQRRLDGRRPPPDDGRRVDLHGQHVDSRQFHAKPKQGLPDLHGQRGDAGIPVVERQRPLVRRRRFVRRAGRGKLSCTLHEHAAESG